MKGLLGKNLGMTQKFNEKGQFVPVTAILCGPCTVVQKKDKGKEGYNALQLGFGEVKKVQNVNRPRKGHFAKAGTPVFRHLAELRFENTENINVGDKIGAEVFQVGDVVSVRGKTKGRGFQGVIKRHGFSGGGAAHGSCFHRAPGSIGQNSDPSRVFKNRKMPGHMGTDFVTMKNLKVVDVDLENNILFVKGAVPGHKNGIVNIDNVSAGWASRIKKIEAGSQKPEAGEQKPEAGEQKTEENK